MIALRPAGTLALPGGHVSAASGAVRVGRFLYVAPDDELWLGVFEDGRPGCRAVAIEGTLPTEQGARKRVKPDFESLALIGSGTDGPGRALLALGSGSAPHRRRAVRWALDDDDGLSGGPEVLDLCELYAELAGRVGELNVEGCAVHGARVLLAQRGNGAGGCNAIAEVALGDLLGGHGPVAGVRDHDLGAIDGVALTFTDLAPLPDGRTLFAAAAEDTDDAYLDGPCLGSALGVLGLDGSVEGLERLEGEAKVEGVTLIGAGGEVELVEDPDDPARAARRFTARLPDGWAA